jgi:hypothetical protein
VVVIGPSVSRSAPADGVSGAAGRRSRLLVLASESLGHRSRDRRHGPDDDEYAPRSLRLQAGLTRSRRESTPHRRAQRRPRPSPSREVVGQSRRRLRPSIRRVRPRRAPPSRVLRLTDGGSTSGKSSRFQAAATVGRHGRRRQRLWLGALRGVGGRGIGGAHRLGHEDRRARPAAARYGRRQKGAPECEAGATEQRWLKVKETLGMLVDSPCRERHDDGQERSEQPVGGRGVPEPVHCRGERRSMSRQVRNGDPDGQKRRDPGEPLPSAAAGRRDSMVDSFGEWWGDPHAGNGRARTLNPA